MTDHTPTPWRLCTTGNLGSAIEAPSGKKYNDLDDGYRIVASYQECTASDLYVVQENNRRANGAFIVKAVNAHDVLVQALQFIADGYDNQDVNHVDFRVKAYEVALDALDHVGSPGHE